MKKGKKDSDSDDFDFDDDDESDSVTNNSAKKPTTVPSYGGKSSSAAFNVDDLISKLLSTKARNIGALDDLKEETII